MKNKIAFLIISTFCSNFISPMYSSAQQSKKVQLKPTKASKVEGNVTFVQTMEGVEINGIIRNLTPGQHALHVHEKGDCSAPDASSAGEHFNPDNAPHGGLFAKPKHAGDFGNITADHTGVAVFSIFDKELKLEGEKSISGRSLIVHAKADDMKSQPSGNSGDRLACGVIS